MPQLRSRVVQVSAIDLSVCPIGTWRFWKTSHRRCIEHGSVRTQDAGKGAHGAYRAVLPLDDVELFDSRACLAAEEWNNNVPEHTTYRKPQDLRSCARRALVRTIYILEHTPYTYLLARSSCLYCTHSIAGGLRELFEYRTMYRSDMGRRAPSLLTAGGPGRRPTGGRGHAFVRGVHPGCLASDVMICISGLHPAQ